MIYYYSIFFLFVIFFFEKILFNWVNFIRNQYDKSYKWPKKNIITNIITENFDQDPIYTKEEFFIHLLYQQDVLLGSNNKPQTYNNEIRYEKNKELITKYSIDGTGNRTNEIFKKNDSKYISSYGDSLCFCRYVDDNNTWQYNLSKKLKKNIKNFGVGNHGLDQAFLKFKRNYKKKIDRPNKVIFLFGPETIRRNLSLWKHYYEFGNYLNFKPAFLFDKVKKKYVLFKIPNFRKKNFYDLKVLKNKTLNYDYFYKSKFSKYMWQKPYILSLRNYGFRKIILLLFFTYAYLKKKKKLSLKFFEKMKIYRKLDILGGLYFDFNDKIKMFKKDFYLSSTLNVIKLAQKFCEQNKIKCYFVIVPTYYDLKYIKKSKNKYYQTLIDQCIKNNYNIINPLNELMEYNPKNIYADKAYGGHLNEKGNKILANYLKSKLNEL